MSIDHARQGRIFREWAALALSRPTGIAVTPRKTAARRSRTLAEKIEEASVAHGPAGDLLGIPNWTIVTSSQHPPAIARVFDAAQVAARLDGNENVAAIVARPGADPDRSYVVLDLPTFARVIGSAS